MQRRIEKMSARNTRNPSSRLRYYYFVNKLFTTLKDAY